MDHMREAMKEGTIRGQEQMLRELLAEIDNIEGMDDIDEVRTKCREILEKKKYWEYQ